MFFTVWMSLAISSPTPAALIETARTYLGTPYAYGGASQGGVDCSGFMQRVFAAHGLVLPRTAEEQVRLGVPVRRPEIRAGDLLFFTNVLGSRRVQHVGLALDANRMIHASTSRRVVVVDSFRSRYYRDRLLSVRRLLTPPAVAGTSSRAVSSPSRAGMRGRSSPPVSEARESSSQSATPARRSASEARR